MKLHNTLTKKVEDFAPIESAVRIYSCGPTVYDHAHIGNLAAFITADTLRRVLELEYQDIAHVMNYTDVDDKTINRSSENYKDLDPKEALAKLTRKFENVFREDMTDIGNDVDGLKFTRATQSIEDMQRIIKELHKKKIAYIADDGVYFSLKAYKDSGKKYGQLVHIDESDASKERISNDEYDKDSAHDFALWKKQKPGEPAWKFELDGKNLKGRPGWHIECSAMSKASLGLPFDIHTGGIDLAFPHHENEIAQSTGATGEHKYANFFVHNEHLLVDGTKMSKSLANFYTLEDIKAKKTNPLAFRLLVLQSHYRTRANFTWKALEAANNRLAHLRRFADLRWQALEKGDGGHNAKESMNVFKNALKDDLDTPKALEELSIFVNKFDNDAPSTDEIDNFNKYIKLVDKTLGLDLSSSKDIDNKTKQLIANRQTARINKDFERSDQLRDELRTLAIEVNDTPRGVFWHRTG